VIAFACLIAIFARLAQAEAHHTANAPQPLIDPVVERYRQDEIARRHHETPSEKTSRYMNALIGIAAAIVLMLLVLRLNGVF
jgi:hypothetical protein